MNRNLPRRRFLQGAVALQASGLLSSAAADADAGRRQVEQAIADYFGAGRSAQNGRVTVSVPAISENGYSVPLSLTVIRVRAASIVYMPTSLARCSCCVDCCPSSSG